MTVTALDTADLDIADPLAGDLGTTDLDTADLGTTDPLAVYAAALRRAGTAGRCELTAVDDAGRARAFRAGDWCAGPIDGDRELLRRCSGPTLEVGCGPGRLIGALAARGGVALGIDLSADAVRLARRRGAPALRRDVFGRLPAEGRWRRVLLADGTIGIGGDPGRLLRRCRELAHPDGRILVEAGSPGTSGWAGPVRISADGGPPSTPFLWAYVGVDELAGLAASAALRVPHTWTEAGRWFAELSSV